MEKNYKYLKNIIKPLNELKNIDYFNHLWKDLIFDLFVTLVFFIF